MMVTDEVLEAARGLLTRPRRLPPWLFYDAAGSALFERITELPEYYLTRLERGIFAEYAGEIVEAVGLPLRVVELGAGSAEKTRVVLAALLERQQSVAYEPVDVSASALDAARERLAAELPQVAVHAQVADYTLGLRLAPCAERRLVMYIGSSVGNFEPMEARALLGRVRAGLRDGDCLLLGVDAAPSLDNAGKSVAELVAAYDDAAGVTAAFNRNVLVRLNRELGADFRPERFRHEARWNAEASRMEMHLVSDREQRVRVAALDAVLDFAEGEGIHTENSYKFRAGEAEEMMESAGFSVERVWSEFVATAGAGEGWFRVLLGRV